MADEKPNRTCTGCAFEKDIESFRLKAGRRQARCRECELRQKREYRALNREALNATSRKHYAENREAELAKTKAWQAANQAKVKAGRKAYRAKHVDEVKQRFSEWRLKNPDYYPERNHRLYYADPEAARARVRKYYIRNRAQILERRREERRANPEQARAEDRRKYAANPSSALARSQRWRVNNYIRYRILSRIYRAKRESAVGHYTEADVDALFRTQNSKCAGCGRKLRSGAFHVDHVMPIAKGGTSWPDNLEILCPTCNSKKHAKHPDEWAKQIGKLFV